jgi:FkbM family methyltransferase
MNFIVRILNKLRLLPYMNLTVSKEIGQRRYIIPITAKTGINHLYGSENWMISTLEKIIPLSNNKSFVDVGVNLGQTLLIVKAIASNMDYVGFEPNPLCVQYVSTLVKVNGIPKTSVIPAALGTTDGIAILYKEKVHADDSAATIVRDFRNTENKEEIIVPLVSANSVASLSQRMVGIVKIDVEGGELEVIETLLNILKRDRPFVICEILPVYNAENTFRLRRQENILALMKQIDYVPLRINLDGSLANVESIGIHKDLALSNYLFTPIENVKSMIGE